MTVRDVVRELTSPNRKNDLEARRRRLGLSRVALGRILDVDPATVFRHERGPLLALWDYALRGIEAEAADKSGKQVLRAFEAGLNHQTFIPDQLAAQGHGLVAEKMHEARRKYAQKSRSRQPPLQDAPATNDGAVRGTASNEKTRIKQIVDHAEARAKTK